MAQTGLKASLLIRCTAEEAAAIREAAKREHRTISGYILNVIMSRIEHQNQLEEQWRKTGAANANRRLPRANS